MSTLDPGVYDSPPWSPAPIVGTPECPAVDGPLRVELATVEINGRVTFVAPSSRPSVRLVGRNKEGTVSVTYETDGTFALRVVPGRYDVVATLDGTLFPHEVTVLEDVEIASTGPLDIAVPAAVTVTGAMTLDGEAAPDPYGHIFVRAVGQRFPASSLYPLVSRMDRGMYSIDLAPGAYDFLYSWCDPTQESTGALAPTRPSRTFDVAPSPSTIPGASRSTTLDGARQSSPTVAPPNPCHDPDHPGFEGTSESPEQRLVPIASNVVITGDRQLDLDVPTVRFSGSIVLEDVSPHVLDLYLASDAAASSIGGEKDFDARIVVGTYAFYGHRSAPAFDHSLIIDRDMHVERTLRAFSLELTHEKEPSVLDLAYAAGFGVSLPVKIAPAPPSLGAEQYDLPLRGSLTVFAGRHRIEHQQAFCWPDYDGNGQIGWRILRDDFLIDGPTTIDLSPPPLARVALDYSDLAEQDETGIALFGTEEGLPPWAVFGATGGRLVAHGLWPVGQYRIKGDVVDIVDGTTILLVEQSRALEVELIVDGAATSPGWSIRLSPADEDFATTHAALSRTDWTEGSGLLLPGRYRVTFNGNEPGVLPRNQGIDLGCVTIEG